MRVLYDYQVFSCQKYGGISRYFYEIANHISRMKGQDIEIFSPLYVNEYFLDCSNVKPRGVKTSNLLGMRRISKLVNPIASQIFIRPRLDVDIYHETYYSNLNNCPSSAKQIITVYDMIHERLPGSFKAQDKTHLAKADAVKRADHVICISESTRQDLIEILEVPEEKTSVVYLGCSLTSRGSDGSKFIGGKNRPYILYVGQRGGYKNFEGLLRAYAGSHRLTNEFCIVCFGGGEFSGHEVTLMESLNLSSDHVAHIEGGDETLACLYASATVFVYPSLYEGFGIPPLEAMTFGCPVICSSSSSIPEVVGDAAGLFDPMKIEEMCAAIESVVFSAEKSKQLALRGYERIKQFSWEKCAQDTLNVYEKVLMEKQK